MVIKISERPVISVETGKALGTFKGLIYKNSKVTFLYCKLSDKYVYIPIKDVHMGPDAIMLKATEDICMLHTNIATKVYTEDGEEIGTVTSIEIDDLFHITGIVVDDLFIEKDKILHMENVIILKANEKAKDSSVLISYTDEKDESPNQCKDTQLVNHKLAIEDGIASIKQLSTPIEDNIDDLNEISDDSIESLEASAELNDQYNENTYTIEDSSESEINTQDNKDEDLYIEIDDRYKYLIGKSLLEDITIARETYSTGTQIDAALIQFAINNNSILKIIMNTED